MCMPSGHIDLTAIGVFFDNKGPFVNRTAGAPTSDPPYVPYLTTKPATDFTPAKYFINIDYANPDSHTKQTRSFEITSSEYARILLYNELEKNMANSNMDRLVYKKDFGIDVYRNSKDIIRIITDAAQGIIVDKISKSGAFTLDDYIKYPPADSTKGRQLLAQKLQKQ